LDKLAAQCAEVLRMPGTKATDLPRKEANPTHIAHSAGNPHQSLRCGKARLTTCDNIRAGGKS